MDVIGFWDKVLSRRKDVMILDGLDIFYNKDDTSDAIKEIALESVVSFIGRIISQSEFRVKKDNKHIKNNTYYQLNVKPNKNNNAVRFWEEVTYKLILEGECLIVQARDGDLLIADNYLKKEYAVMENYFTNVIVQDFELAGTFKRSEVIFLEYGNDTLNKLIDGLYGDYGGLITRMFEFKKLDNQLRATVDVDMQTLKSQTVVERDDEGNIIERKNPLQTFIDKAYESIRKKAVAIIPQQNGMKYEEHSNKSSRSQSVDEINKLVDSFLDQVCHAVGLPPNLLKGDMADIENMTKNAMKFCIDPILKIIKNELDGQLISKSDYIDGKEIDIKRISHRDIFDIAVAVDKLRSSSVVNGHELRDELGLEYSDDPIHEKYILTKNYEEAGEKEDVGEN